MIELFPKLKKLFSLPLRIKNEKSAISKGIGNNNPVIYSGNGNIQINAPVSFSSEKIIELEIPEDVKPFLRMMANGRHAIVARDESGIPEQVNISESNDIIMPLTVFNFLKEKNLIFEIGKVGYALDFIISETGRKIMNQRNE